MKITKVNTQSCRPTNPLTKLAVRLIQTRAKILNIIFEYFAKCPDAHKSVGRILNKKKKKQRINKFSIGKKTNL